MVPCIYTKQKVKKIKKWIDGYVLFKRFGLRLYNDEQEFLYNSENYQIIDDYIDTPMYLIYLDNLQEVIKQSNENMNVSNVINDQYQNERIRDNIQSGSDLLTYKKNKSKKINFVKEPDYEKKIFLQSNDEKLESKDSTETMVYERVKGRSIDDIRKLFDK